MSNHVYSRLMLHVVQLRSPRMSAQSLQISLQNHALIPTYVIRISLFPPDLRVQQPNIAPPISPPVVLESACPIPLPAVPEDTPPEAQSNSSERAPPRLFKWLRLRINTPARPTFLQRVKLPFLKQPRRQDEEGIELKERPPSIVDVPLSPGLPVSTPFLSQMFKL